MKKGQTKKILKRPKPYWRKSRAKWVARVPVGDGKFRTSSHSTKSEAIAAIDALWSRRQKGGSLQVTTFAHVVDAWLASGTEWKVKTREDYKMAVAKMESLYEVPIDFVLTEHIDSMLREIKTAPMRRRVRKTLGTILQFAVRKKFCSDNPARQTDPIKSQRSPIEVFEPGEVDDILDSINRLNLAVKLMYLLALRPGELWALQWGDWNRKKGTLQIKRNVKEVRGVQHVETPKTSSSQRVLPLGEAAIEALTEQLALAVKEGRASKTDIIFASANGGYVRARNFQRNWKQGLEDAGVEYRKLYTLRHTAATLWLNSGLKLAAVSKWLGHANITTTLRHYSHLMLDDLDEVRDFWNRRIG